MVLAMRRKAHGFRRWHWKASMLFLGIAGIVLMLRLHYMLSPSDTVYDLTLLSSSPARPKLAFLFLARNRMPLEFLWEHFFRGSEGHDFSIYIHARPGFVFTEETTHCQFFIDRQMKNSIQVEWGEASMIEAEHLLLSKALEDPANERFILLSDSCIPLYNFSYTYEYIMSSNKSFLDSFIDKQDKQHNPKMAPTIPREKWRKGSQWFVLIRKHAELVVADETIFPVFRKHCKRSSLPEFWRESDLIAFNKTGSHANCIPDEHYIQTLIAFRWHTGSMVWENSCVLGCPSSVKDGRGVPAFPYTVVRHASVFGEIKGSEEELERRTLTYSLWKVTDKGRQGWHPVTFNFAEASLKVVKDIQAIRSVYYASESRTEWCRSNGVPRPCYLFARKFTRGAGVRLYNQIKRPGQALEAHKL